MTTVDMLKPMKAIKGLQGDELVAACTAFVNELNRDECLFLMAVTYRHLLRRGITPPDNPFVRFVDAATKKPH